MKNIILTEIARIREVMGIENPSRIMENALIIKVISKAGVRKISKKAAKQLKQINQIINGGVSNAALVKELRAKGLINDAEELLPDNLSKMPAEQQGKVVAKLLMTDARFVDAFAGKLTAQVGGEVEKFIDPRILSDNANVLMNNLGITFDASDLVKLGDDIFGSDPNLIQLAIRKGNKNFPEYFFTRGGFNLNTFMDFGRKALQDIFDARIFGKTDLDRFLREIEIDADTTKKVKAAFSNGKPITDTATQQKLINAILADSDLMNEFFDIIRRNKDLKKLVRKKGFTSENLKAILGGKGSGLTDEYVQALEAFLKEDPTWLKILKGIRDVILWTPKKMTYPLSIYVAGYLMTTWTINQISEWLVAKYGGAGDKGKPNDALSPAMYQSVENYPYLATTLAGITPREANDIAVAMEDALEGWNAFLISGVYEKEFKVAYDTIPTILGWSMVTHFYEKNTKKSLKDEIAGMSIDVIPYPFRKMKKDSWLYDITKENVYKDIKLKPYATTLNTSADDRDLIKEIGARWPKYPPILYMDDEPETPWYRLRSGHIPAKVLGGLLESQCPETLVELQENAGDEVEFLGVYKDINNCLDGYLPQNFNTSYIDTTGDEIGAYSDTKPSTEVKEEVLDLKDIIQQEDDGAIEDVMNQVEEILNRERGTNQ